MEVCQSTTENPVLLPTSNENEEKDVTNASINTCKDREEVSLQDKIDSETSSAVIGGEVMSILGLIGCHDSVDDPVLQDESLCPVPETTSQFEAHFISEQQLLHVLHVEQIKAEPDDGAEEIELSSSQHSTLPENDIADKSEPAQCVQLSNIKVEVVENTWPLIDFPTDHYNFRRRSTNQHNTLWATPVVAVKRKACSPGDDSTAKKRKVQPRKQSGGKSPQTARKRKTKMAAVSSPKKASTAQKKRVQPRKQRGRKSTKTTRTLKKGEVVDPSPKDGSTLKKRRGRAPKLQTADSKQTGATLDTSPRLDGGTRRRRRVGLPKQEDGEATQPEEKPELSLFDANGKRRIGRPPKHLAHLYPKKVKRTPKPRIGDLKSKSEIRPEGCDICHKWYMTPRLLRKHQYRVHKKISHRMMCDFCQKRFTIKESLRLHILDCHLELTENEKPNNTCTFCGKDFPLRRSLINHIRALHINNNYKFICDICKTRYKNKSSITTHIVNFHVYYNKKSKPKCKYCGLKFNLKGELKRHTRTKECINNNPIICTLCQGFYKNENTYKNHMWQYHYGSHVGKMYPCDKCDKNYNYKNDLVFHQKLKHGPMADQKFKCDFCGKCFQLKRVLQTHIMYLHGPGVHKRIQCKLCHCSYKRENHLNRHVKQFHGVNIKAYKCMKCHVSCRNKLALIMHMDNFHKKRLQVNLELLKYEF